MYAEQYEWKTYYKEKEFLLIEAKNIRDQISCLQEELNEIEKELEQNYECDFSEFWG